MQNKEEYRNPKRRQHSGSFDQYTPANNNVIRLMQLQKQSDTIEDMEHEIKSM